MKTINKIFFILYCLFIASCDDVIIPASDDTSTPTSTKTYSIGGEVTGLIGTLGLLNNTNNNFKSLTSNGDFTFGFELESGDSYEIVVESSPESYTCTVFNGTGTITSADITDITVECSYDGPLNPCTLSPYIGWVDPSSLSDNISPDGESTQYPRVAMDNNCNVIVAWIQDDGSNDQVFKSEYRNGIWDHPNSLTDNISPDGQDVEFLRLAMDNDGNALIVWTQSDGSNDQIFKSEYRNGTWDHPNSLTDNISPDGYSAVNSQVAMDDNGNAIIVWPQYNGSINQMFKSEYRSGAWDHPDDINDDFSPNTSTFNPHVAMDNNGNAIITWVQTHSSIMEVFISEYRSGAWDHPSATNDNISVSGQATLNPQVAMSDNGDAVIVWYQSNGSNNQIFMSEYRNNTWDHPSSLNDNISPDNRAATNPRVTMDEDGNTIIVWQQSDTADEQIFKSEYRDSGSGFTWTHPSSLTDNISVDGQDADNPQVAMDDNGQAVITWTQSNGSHDQTFKSDYRDDGSGFGWTHPSSINDNISTDGTSAGNAQVAMDNNGQAIIVWNQSDSSNNQVFVSEYR